MHLLAENAKVEKKKINSDEFWYLRGRGGGFSPKYPIQAENNANSFLTVW